MFKLPSPGFLIQAFSQVIRRFPLTMVATAFGVLALWVLTEDSRDGDNWVKMWMVGLLGLPIFTGMTAFSESRQWGVGKSWMLQGLGVIFLGIYWYLLDLDAPGLESRVISEYVTMLLISHLFVAVAPYLNDRPVRDFWEYNKQLFANFILGAAFTMILYFGLCLAILAVDQLFDLNIRERIYVQLFILLAGMFNTAYFLFHFPKEYSFNTSSSDYSFVFKNLCKYILIPVVALYFVILYAYSFKIIGTWTLPRGWVSSLVAGFSVAGILTYLLNYYLSEHDDSPQVHAYHRWFWWILLPMTPLLFVAIGRRISDYGVTEERFLVAQLGIWLLLNCLFFLFSKKDNIKFIPITLGLFALGWAFGPLSARAVSLRSQMSRLTETLARNDRFENGQLKQSTTKVAEADREALESAFYFFDSRGAMHLLDNMLPMPVDSLPEKNGFYGSSGKLAAWLGFPPLGTTTAETAPISVYVTERNDDGLTITGYDLFFAINLYHQEAAMAPDSGYYFSINKAGSHIQWMEGKEKAWVVIDSFDLKPVISNFLSKELEYNSLQLKHEEAVFDLKSAAHNIRLAIQNATIQRPETGPQIESLSGYLLLKKK